MMSCCLTTYVILFYLFFCNTINLLFTIIIFLFFVLVWTGEEAGKGEEVGSYCG